MTWKHTDLEDTAKELFYTYADTLEKRGDKFDMAYLYSWEGYCESNKEHGQYADTIALIWQLAMKAETIIQRRLDND